MSGPASRQTELGIEIQCRWQAGVSLLQREQTSGYRGIDAADGERDRWLLRGRQQAHGRRIPRSLDT